MSDLRERRPVGIGFDEEVGDLIEGNGNGKQCPLLRGPSGADRALGPQLPVGLAIHVPLADTPASMPLMVEGPMEGLSDLVRSAVR